ncbi:MAG: fibronectin type III domain-containing protein [Elusimicrobia bacterium]|nr:fibronectin type III domain-containing protein [Elusimicrobiota bacterium]
MSSATFSASQTYARSIAVNAAGNIFTAGNTQSHDLWVARFDGNSVFISSVTIDGPANGTDSAQSVTLDPSGNGIVVAGYVGESGGKALFLGRYDSQLALISSTTLTRATASDVVPIGTGFGVAGTSETISRMLTAKYDAALVLQSSAASSSSSWGQSISTDPSGNFYVSGTNFSISPQFHTLVKFNSALVEIASAAVIDSNFNIVSGGVKVSGDGSVWTVAALSALAGGNTFSKLLKYDQNLNLLGSVNLDSGISVEGMTLGSHGSIWIVGENLQQYGWVAQYNSGLTLISSMTFPVSSGNDAFISGISKAPDDSMWISGTLDYPHAGGGALGHAWFAHLGDPTTTPSLSAVVQSTGSIQWSWNDVERETSYRVVSAANANVSGDLPPDTVSWTEFGLSTNTAYARRVVSLNGISLSTSAELTRYTLAAPPTSFALTSVDISSISVSWAANTNPGITSYRVDRWTAGSATTSVTVAAASASLTGLFGGTTYYLRVAALNGDGMETLMSSALLSTATLIATSTAATIGSGGGAILYAAPSGPVTVIIPPQAFSGAVGVTLQTPTSFPSDTSPTANLTGSNVGIEIVLDQAVQPSQDVTITMTYQAGDILGLDAHRLIIARYDTTRNVWVPLVSTSNMLQRQVTARTNHFSLFRIMQAAASGTVDTALAFPNPLRPSQGHTLMTFANLPAGARIRIYTLSGQLVRDLSANAVGMASWDGRNQSGEKAASGTYAVFAQGAGQSKTFKVIVQR